MATRRRSPVTGVTGPDAPRPYVADAGGVNQITGSSVTGSSVCGPYLAGELTDAEQFGHRVGAELLDLGAGALGADLALRGLRLRPDAKRVGT
jgi:hypothetical protein